MEKTRMYQVEAEILKGDNKGKRYLVGNPDILTKDKEGFVRCSRKTQLTARNWDYVYSDAVYNAEMKRQKEINHLLDEIQRLRSLVFTLED